MSHLLVSILTPFKNTASYLPACLNSILDQSYANWELIIINDSSTDNSFDIVKSFAQNNERIKLYNNPHQGIISALQFAYANSKGQLITRMDSDDIMAKNKLETMVNALTLYGKGHIALGKVTYFSHTKISAGYIQYQKWLNALTEKGNNFNEIYKECVIASPCWMVYREDLENCGAFNYENYPEDYDLTFRFYKQGLKCIPSDTVLHYWRDYETRTSKTQSAYALEAFVKLKTMYFIEIDHNNLRPLVIWGAGYKGKIVAKELLDKEIPFYWISENPNKSKKLIYGQKLRSLETFNELINPQSIITFSNENSQKQLHKFFNDRNMIELKDYFMFC